MRDFLTLIEQRRKIVAFVLLSLIGSTLEATVLLSVVAAASSVISDSDVHLRVGPVDNSFDVHVVLLVAFIATLLFVCCRLMAGWTIASLTARTLDTARRRIVSDLLRASWTQQATVSSARLQDLVSMQSLRMTGLLSMLGNFLTSLIAFSAMVAAAMLIDVPTAAVLLATGTALALLFRPITKHLRKSASSHLTETHRYVALVDEIRGVLPELRVYGVQDRARELHAAASAAAAEAQRRMRLAAAVQPSLYMGIVLLLLTGGLLVLSIQQEVDVALAGAIVLVLLRGLRYSQAAQASWHSAVELLPYVDDFVAVRGAWKPEATHRRTRRLEHVGVLRLESLSYTYPTGEAGIRDINLEIQPGAVVGLAGPSGVGKTTLAHVLLGLLEPTGGTLYVDGVPSTEFDETSWFSRFAYVAQQPVLLDRDVRENVRFFRSDITDEGIARALSEAAMDNDLVEWAAGGQRQVGVGGSEVSGGQRQRIAIARALAGEPDVLILDEPTSALDPEAEGVVRETLHRLRGRLTVILIAHRESTLDICDTVVRMQSGRIDHIHNRANSGALTAATNTSHGGRTSPGVLRGRADD